MIIINCDDFAIERNTSEAILICGENHKINSTTIMATKILGDETIARLLCMKHISPGIHLYFDHLIPFDSAHFYGCNQYDRDDSFFPLHSSLKNRIIEETHLQIKTLLSMKIPISHFDSHDNVHLFPEISPLVFPVLRSYNINRCRYSSQFFIDESTRNNFINLCRNEVIFHPFDSVDFNNKDLNIDELSKSRNIYEIMCHIDLKDNFMKKYDNYKRLMSMSSYNSLTFNDLPA
jgi:predicted glycoside hydrolase/deacetylase ChbG (UPF0249 family)